MKREFNPWRHAMMAMLALVVFVTIVGALTHAHHYPSPLKALAVFAIDGVILLVGLLLGLWIGAQRQGLLVRQLTTALEKQTALAREMAALAADEAKKRTQTVEAVAIIEGERNKWKEMFINCGLGHSAAQDMMMRERERLVHRLHQLGDKPERFLNPATEQVLSEFKQKYGDPAVLEKGDRIKPTVDKPAGHE